MEQIQEQPGLMSLEDYLECEERSEVRHEFHSLPGNPTLGEVLAMSGATEGHNLLVVNLTGLLHAKLRGSKCRLMTQDMRVLTPEAPSRSPRHGVGDAYLYPDLLATCQPRRYLGEDGPGATAKKTTLLNPELVVEVASDSTQLYDRKEKFTAYRSIPSLKEYVLLQQDWPLVETFTRSDDGAWSMRVYTGDPAGTDEAFPLSPLGVTLAITDVYEGVELVPPTGDWPSSG